MDDADLVHVIETLYNRRKDSAAISDVKRRVEREGKTLKQKSNKSPLPSDVPPPRVSKHTTHNSNSYTKQQHLSPPPPSFPKQINN